MTDEIAHRGPDEDGHRIDGSVGLGFRRLSIIDVSGSHQPMSNEDERVWLLFNGVLGIVAGAVAVLWPGITVLAFVILVAAWALISGTFILISAFLLKIDHGRIWLAIGGIASVVFGVLLVISPFIGALVLTFWTGAHALVLGGAHIVLAYRLRSHRTGRRSNLVGYGAA